MVVKDSQGLWSASWRWKRGSGIVWSESAGLRTKSTSPISSSSESWQAWGLRGANVLVWVQKQEKIQVSPQDSWAGGVPFHLAFLFYWDFQWIGWGLLIFMEGICFTWPIQMLTPTRNTWNNVWLNVWAPWGQTSCHTKWTITEFFLSVLKHDVWLSSGRLSFWWKISFLSYRGFPVHAESFLSCCFQASLIVFGFQKFDYNGSLSLSYLVFMECLGLVDSWNSSFFFLALPAACGISQARDQTCITTATQVLQWQCWILNLLCHKRTPEFI